MRLHTYHNSFISISFPVLFTYRPTTSVNREQRCHYPVTQHGVINGGKQIVLMLQVCAVIYNKPSQITW
jgi:hypothetical protein